MQDSEYAINLDGRHFDHEGVEVGGTSEEVVDGREFMPGIHCAHSAPLAFQETKATIKRTVISRLSRGRQVVLAGTIAAGFIVGGIRTPDGLVYATTIHVSS